jgi:hypothetical protein
MNDLRLGSRTVDLVPPLTPDRRLVRYDFGHVPSQRRPNSCPLTPATASRSRRGGTTPLGVAGAVWNGLLRGFFDTLETSGPAIPRISFSGGRPGIDCLKPGRAYTRSIARQWWPGSKDRLAGDHPAKISGARP